jgi:hypothetical protein
MSHTLDDLLDVTGLAELRSGGLSKTAKEAGVEEDHEYFLKLAERCERAAAEAPTEAGEAKERELQEKTAAIAIIAKTLDEIEALSGAATEKVASADLRAVAFVERAIASGHSPEAIATFMKEAGLLSRGMHGLLGRGKMGIGDALKHMGGDLAEKGTRHFGVALRDAARNMTPARADRYIEKLRASYGDEAAKHLIDESGARLNHLPSVRDLIAKKPDAKNVLSMSMGGGKGHGVTADQLKTVGKPAAAVAGGLAAGKALFGGDAEDPKKKPHGNVTVINP